MDDSSITDLFFERSEGAVEALAEKYGGACFKLAFNILGSREDAEEIVSDAYLAVWNCVPPQRPDMLGAFLLKIVRNKAVSRCRMNNAQMRGGVTACLEELKDCLPSDMSVEKALEQAELGEALSHFIEGLGKENRRLFIRRYWYLDSPADIAGQTGLSPEAVRARLSRLRKKLKKYLGSRGVEI